MAAKSGSSNKALIPLLVVGAVVVVGAGAWVLMSGDEEPETPAVRPPVRAVSEPAPVEPKAAAPKPRSRERTRERTDTAADDSGRRATPTPTKKADDESSKRDKKKKPKKKKPAKKKTPPSAFREPGIG
ncbi:MAG: hypothetical protein GY778_00835 [bacterium]|nr:hypothetical protein [bacterium]